MATIGVDFKTKEVNYKDVKIKLFIWDTVGQERFSNIAKFYARNADGIMYVYDITQQQTFENLKAWIERSESWAQGFKKIIIGNKCDLEKERQVQKNKVSEFCEKYQISEIQVSAMQGTNVDNAFQSLIDMIVGEKTEEELINFYTKRRAQSGVKLRGNKKKKKKKCCQY